jgi:hypothetical protein
LRFLVLDWFYAQNKAAIAKRQSEKECCKYCGRSVRHDNIFKHTRSSYCMNRRKLNKAQIAADKKAMFKKIESNFRNMETLCLETQLIAYAATPFVGFKKLATKKNVNFSEYKCTLSRAEMKEAESQAYLDEALEDEEEEYMNKYRDICRRLNCGDIEYDDLTEWEQDLCANRGVYLHMC